MALHIVRLHLLWLLCLVGLTNCAYYGDIHGHAKPLSFSDLNSHHVYTTFTKHDEAFCWSTFHDPLLNQLIATALVDSPNLQTAQIRVSRAAALSAGAAASLWPTIDFSGYAQRQKFSKFGLVPPPFNGRIFNIGEAGFNFNYDFDFWGKNRQILASQISEQCAEQADLAEARLIISAAVAHTYLQLLNEDKATRLAMENLQLSLQISRIVVDRATHGIESDIPVKTALANAESARLAVERYKQAAMLLRNQLAILLGKNPFNTDIITPPYIYHKQIVALPTALPANLIARRPDINAAKLRVQAAAHQINAAKARFFPNISLMALFSYQSVGLERLFNVENQNNAITGAIDLPIFDAGARRAHLGVKYAEYDLAVTNYNQTILTALREVADQLAILKSVKRQLHTEQNALKATAHNYKLFKSRYNHGIIDYVPVLEIKQLLLQHQSVELDLQTRHNQAIVAMLKALGGNTMSGQG